MKKILITRKLLRSCEEKAQKIFDANFNLNDELYSQKKLIEMRMIIITMYINFNE